MIHLQDMSIWFMHTLEVGEYGWTVPDFHRLMLGSYSSCFYTYNLKVLVF